MNPGRILRAGITGSAIAHLSVLMLVLFFTEVHPFGSVTAEPITVDIVTSAEAPPAPKTEEPTSGTESEAVRHLRSFFQTGSRIGAGSVTAARSPATASRAAATTARATATAGCIGNAVSRSAATIWRPATAARGADNPGLYAP